MIGYVTMGTNDMERASAFYDELFDLVEVKRLVDMDRFILWARSFEEGGFAIAVPFDGNPATVGNGAMAAIRAESRDIVDALHAKALELGGTDEGAPGPRGDGFYAGYFRDLEGNKLNAFALG